MKPKALPNGYFKISILAERWDTSIDYVLEYYGKLPFYLPFLNGKYTPYDRDMLIEEMKAESKSLVAYMEEIRSLHEVEAKLYVNSEDVLALELDRDAAEAGAGNKAATVPAVKNETAEPWRIIDPRDPIPIHEWYTPARYFARQLVISDSTLLTKRKILSAKIVQSLTTVGIMKRGGKLPFEASTIKKALSNVSLG